MTDSLSASSREAEIEALKAQIEDSTTTIAELFAKVDTLNAKVEQREFDHRGLIANTNLIHIALVESTQAEGLSLSTMVASSTDRLLFF